MLILTLILVFCLEAALSHKCDSFSNVNVKVSPDSGPSYLVNVTGCIERTAFHETIVEVHIENQNLLKLGRDSIRNMKNLKSATFYQNGIEVVEPGALRNVPSLKYLKIEKEKLAEVRRGIFSMAPQLQSLKLSYNKIRYIEDEAFANIETLEALYIDHNQLTEWKMAWFVNTTNLVTINFGFNKIKTIPRRAFADFTKIRTINFNYNDLEVIESEAFRDITNLDYLGIKHNKLKTIHPRVFPNEIVISSMAIEANYLNFLSKRVLVTISVKKLSIDGNPWKCPCLDQVLLWLHETNGTAVKTWTCSGRNIPVCVSPTSFSQTCREIVEDDVTNKYLEELKKIDPPLDTSCARLD